MHRLTIREIAKMADVSVSTVSRVINGMPDVNDITRIKVRKLIEEHGYIPNASARALKQINTKMICIVVKGMHNPFFAPIVELMQQEIEKTKYIPIVHYIDESSDEISAAAQLITEKKALGIVFLGGDPTANIKSISRFKVPCVLSTMPAQNQKLKNVSSVCVDDHSAASEAAGYLLDRGHRSIAILGGKRLDRDLVWNRYTGAKDAIERRGFEFDEDLYLQSKFSLEDSYKTVKNILGNKDKRFTAIFAMSDIMAIGAMKAITDCGYNVPEDISVLGFDGIAIGRYLNPTLTSVAQPYEAIAKRSTELLIGNIEGIEERKNIVLNTKIIEGASVRTNKTDRN